VEKGKVVCTQDDTERGAQKGRKGEKKSIENGDSYPLMEEKGSGGKKQGRGEITILHCQGKSRKECTKIIFPLRTRKGVKVFEGDRKKKLFSYKRFLRVLWGVPLRRWKGVCRVEKWVEDCEGRGRPVPHVFRISPRHFFRLIVPLFSENKIGGECGNCWRN